MRWDKLVFVYKEGAERKAVCKSQGIDPPAPLVYTETLEMAMHRDQCLLVSAGNSKLCGETGLGREKPQIAYQALCFNIFHLRDG